MAIVVYSFTAKSITDINELIFHQLNISGEICKLTPIVVRFKRKIGFWCDIILYPLGTLLGNLSTFLMNRFTIQVQSIAWGNEKDKDLSDEKFVHQILFIIILIAPSLISVQQKTKPF